VIVEAKTFFFYLIGKKKIKNIIKKKIKKKKIKKRKKKKKEYKLKQLNNTINKKIRNKQYFY